MGLLPSSETVSPFLGKITKEVRRAVNKFDYDAVQADGLPPRVVMNGEQVGSARQSVVSGDVNPASEAANRLHGICWIMRERGGEREGLMSTSLQLNSSSDAPTGNDSSWSVWPASSRPP